jgi:hypothetical protein
MGGSGSGRWGSRRPVVEHMARIDLVTIWRQYPITRLSKLTSSYTRWNGQRVTAEICFDQTTTRFGGSRLWFVCPSCRQRCRVLFGSWRIACRCCHRLRYGSQIEKRAARARKRPTTTCRPNLRHALEYIRPVGRQVPGARQSLGDRDNAPVRDPVGLNTPKP